MVRAKQKDTQLIRRQINMKTIAEEMRDPLVMAEDEAVARFYDHVGLGAEYRAAETSNETRRVIREFRNTGYKVARIELEDENTFRMILWHNGVVTAWQDITVTIDISPMGGA